MKLIEVVYTLLIMGILASTTWFAYSFSLPNNTQAALTTFYAIQRTRMLALIDYSKLGYVGFGDIYEFARVDSKRLLTDNMPFYWQLQFHTSGIYTKNSLSIYRDTPRFASTTDFDKRPLAGDIVALHASSTQCLSGYNNSNITGFCKDNALIDFRLYETTKVQTLALGVPTTCQEKDTFRFYFNDYGGILCGLHIHAPQGLQRILVGNIYIAIEPQTGYAFLQ